MTRGISLLAMLICAFGAGAGPGRVVEIARGHSWVSPYWGYSSPKIVCDGKAYYTAGLWGAKPDQAEGVLYRYDGVAWRAGARFPNIYQPITLALDREGRLIAAYTEQLKPVNLWRSKSPGGVDALDRLPSPADMKNAYYIGIAIRDELLYLAYISTPEYSMFLATLNLTTQEWSPSRLVCRAQVEHKPKTAWTYPILYPAKEGLHFVASNSPDGGEGNSYDRVWYLFYPAGVQEPSIREVVAETPMGHISYATDFATDASGVCHVVYMWNQRSYGDPLPPDSPPAGIYHAWRDPEAGIWRRDLLMPAGNAGFYESDQGLMAATTSNRVFLWTGAQEGWKDRDALCDAARMPDPPGFFDVISRASGSDTRGGIAVVTDSLMPAEQDKPQERVLWSILPE
jgi:hypothetical protein